MTKAKPGGRLQTSRRPAGKRLVERRKRLFPAEGNKKKRRGANINITKGFYFYPSSYASEAFRHIVNFKAIIKGGKHETEGRLRGQKKSKDPHSFAYISVYISYINSTDKH